MGVNGSSYSATGGDRGGGGGGGGGRGAPAAAMATVAAFFAVAASALAFFTATATAESRGGRLTLPPRGLAAVVGFFAQLSSFPMAVAGRGATNPPQRPSAAAAGPSQAIERRAGAAATISGSAAVSSESAMACCGRPAGGSEVFGCGRQKNSHAQSSGCSLTFFRQPPNCPIFVILGASFLGCPKSFCETFFENFSFKLRNSTK